MGGGTAAVIDDFVPPPGSDSLHVTQRKRKKGNLRWKEVPREQNGVLKATKNEFCVWIPCRHRKVPKEVNAKDVLSCEIVNDTMFECKVTKQIAERYRQNPGKKKYIGDTKGKHAKVSIDAFDIKINEQSWKVFEPDGRSQQRLWGLMKFVVISRVAGNQGGGSAESVKLTLRVSAGDHGTAEPHEFTADIKDRTKEDRAEEGVALKRSMQEMSQDAQREVLKFMKCQLCKELKAGPPPAKRRRLHAHIKDIDEQLGLSNAIQYRSLSQQREPSNAPQYHSLSQQLEPPGAPQYRSLSAIQYRGLRAPVNPTPVLRVPLKVPPINPAALVRKYADVWSAIYTINS